MEIDISIADADAERCLHVMHLFTKSNYAILHNNSNKQLIALATYIFIFKVK